MISGTAEIVTVLASSTTDLDVPDEALDSWSGSCNRDSWDTEQPGSPGHAEAPSSLNGNTQDMEQPDEALDSREGSCERDTRDTGSLRYPGLLSYQPV